MTAFEAALTDAAMRDLLVVLPPPDHFAGYAAAVRDRLIALHSETTPAGVLDEAALAFMEHVQAQGCDHAESKAGSHTGCPQVLALAVALGRSGSGGGRG